MAIDSASPRTRRALLGAGLGAGIAAISSALGRPGVVNAANGDPFILGSLANTATSKTKLGTAIDEDHESCASASRTAGRPHRWPRRVAPRSACSGH